MTVPPVLCDDIAHFTQREMGNSTKFRCHPEEMPDKFRSQFPTFLQHLLHP
jgi:hypothetical protein